MITYVFDKLDTADGYEIYWLYKEGANTNEYNNDVIDPDDLFYDMDAFKERCRDIVLDEDCDYINYAIEEDEIEMWKQEALDEQDFYREVTERRWF